MNTLTDSSTSQKRLVIILILCHVAAMALFMGWRQTQEPGVDKYGKMTLQYVEGEEGGFWKSLDYSVFRTLNGSLKDNPPAQTFWAIANNRAFDIVQAVLMGIVLWFGAFHKATPEQKLERIKFGFFLALATILCIQIFHFTLFHWGRISPSKIVDGDVVRLSKLEHITWSLKDGSRTSFPGDHATVLFIIAIYITFFGGMRWGALAFVVAVLCSLPRLVGGAHWATDVLVGGTFIALIATGWTFCCRWKWFGPELFHWPSMLLMRVAGRFIPALRPPGSEVPEKAAAVAETGSGLLGESSGDGPERPVRGPKDYLYLFFTGVCMGAADIVPGVSGGTMAFIMGIYEELLDAIKSFNLQLVRLALKFKIKECFDHVPWKFLLVLGSGILITLKLLADAVHGVLGDPVGKIYLYAFFFGLVVASIAVLSRHFKWSPATVVAFVVGTVAAWLIVGLVPAEMPHTAPYIFFSGMIAIMAMILPGISGSFILLILGQYAFVVGALKDLDFKVFAIFGVGAAIGLCGFARLLSWLLKRYHALTIAALIGFMTGSLRKIWPFKDAENTTYIEDRHGEMMPMSEPNRLPDFSGSEWWISLGLAVLGMALILVLEAVNKRASDRREIV